MELQDIKFFPSENIVTSELDDEIIALNINTGKYFEIRGTAKIIWNYVSSGKDNYQDIFDEINSKFDEDENILSTDLEDFLQKALEFGFLDEKNL